MSRTVKNEQERKNNYSISLPKYLVDIIIKKSINDGDAFSQVITKILKRELFDNEKNI